jgi:probable rRNA maturation factor
MELDFSSIYEEYNDYETLFIELIKDSLKHLSLKCDPILSVSFVDNDTIQIINRDYRGLDRPTDVISFAFIDSMPNGKDKLKKEEIIDLGEIYISIPKAIEQAKEYSHSLNREICFLFVHGLLHLLGYDHMNENDEKIMFSLQDDILNLRGITR